MIGWTGGPGHLTIIVGTGGGAFVEKKCPQGRAVEQFFQMPGYARGLAQGGGGVLAGGNDSHIILVT